MDEKAEAGEKEEGEPAFNPFWFVTQRHPAAVESPAQDGNVGQMLYTTEEKRGELGWFVRETGSYGLRWALKNSSKLLKVTILNCPLTVSSPVPGVLKQLRLPLFGEFTCQNAILAERFIEADDDMKPVIGCISPSARPSLWDGVIQLQRFTVFVLAFFISGKKIQDIVWPKTIEIKGRVKWGDFKKFLKDLRHSQNRSIMVISLCLNAESSKDGLEGMEEVAKILKVNKRIGLARIEDDTCIYVCPGQKEIITVLQKYGFWKGASTVDTNRDSLIGFVVRDRKSPVNTSNGEISIDKIPEIGGTRMEAQEVIYDQRSLPVHPLHVPVDDGLYFRRPPLVLAAQGSYCPYPPPGLLGHGFHAQHPAPGLPGQGLHPRHPPRAPECQGVFHWHPPCARDQGFISHRPPSFAPEYFRPLTDHGNNNNGSQHLRPPSDFAPGRVWPPMSHPRPGNDRYGFERSQGFSGSSSTYYSRFRNGSGSMPPN